MNYSLKRKNNYKSLYYYNEVGFIIEPNSGGSKYKVNISKVTLIDQDFINHYIIKAVNKKFEKLFMKMYEFLTEDDEDPSETPLILDEIEKLQRIVINKYKEYISEEMYKSILKKLLIAEEEFKKSYNEKLYYRSIQVPDYQESRGKSR